MNLKGVFITLLTLLLLASGSYFGYQYYQEHSQKVPLKVIPSNAYAVVKVDPSKTDSIKYTPFVVSEIKSYFIAKDEEEMFAFSLHPAGDQSDWVIYMSPSTTLDQTFFTEKGFSVMNENAYKRESLVIYKKELNDVIVYSSAAYLLDEVKKKMENHELLLGDSDHRNISIYPSDVMNTLDTSSFSKTLKVLNEQVIDIATDRVGDDYLFNGYCDIKKATHSYLGVVAEQKAADFTLQHLIPASAQYITYLNISNGATFMDGIQRYSFHHKLGLDDSWKSLEDDFGVTMQDFFLCLEGLAGMTSFKNDQQQHKVCYLPIREHHKNQPILEEFLTSIEEGPLKKIDTYKGYTILGLNTTQLPELILGDIVGEYQDLYTCFYHDYLLFSDTPVGIKKIIYDVEMDNVWGRSIDEVVKIETYLSSSNFGLYVPDVTKKSLQLNQLPFSVSDYGTVLAFQVMCDDDQYFVSGAVGNYHVSMNNMLAVVEEEEDESSLSNQESNTIYLSNKIITKPYLLRNHHTKKYDVLVQDSAYMVQLFSVGGKRLWHYQLDGPLVGDVQQIDLYKNGKLQYVMATKTGIHCVDRLGRKVENYPWNLPERDTIAHWSIVDYNRTRDYRYFIDNIQGELYLTNSKGKTLGAWTPNKSTRGKLVSPPQHVRIKEKDYMVALEVSGNLNVFRRNASIVPHFPIKLKSKAQTELFIEKGNDFSNTYFSFIDSENKLLKYNLFGKQVVAKQLNSGLQNLSITSILGTNSYLIIGWNENSSFIYNNEGKLLAMVPLTFNNQLIQAYSLEGKKILFFTDLQSKQIKAYTSNGLEKPQLAIESSNGLAILKLNGKKIKVFTTFENEIRISDNSF